MSCSSKLAISSITLALAALLLQMCRHGGMGHGMFASFFGVASCPSL